MRERLIRLDQVARAMNAWLLAIAIGLGMLDLTVLAAKCLPVLPETPAATADYGPGTAVSSPAIGDRS